VFELSPTEWTAILLSLRVATVATLVATPLGIAVAWLLARREFWGKSVADAAIHLPLVLPPVVTGYLLLLTFGRRGAVGAWLADHFGIVFAFRWTGAALACGIMSFPLLVRPIRLSIEAVDRRLEQAAGTLGAAPWKVFLTVTLPLALPGVLAGMVLGFAKAIGEFGATITFVSNIPGETQTISSAELIMLRVDVAKRLGDFSIEASFTSEGRVTGLFGASGAGKTSLINMIAGLLRPDRGIIAVDGETLDDTMARTHVPVHRRRIGYVFQDARLFPHLDVRQNLDYGRSMNGLAEDGAQHRRVTELLDIGNLLDRRPGRLSGGERQRVALGRALLSRPRLLLLDEPLGSLDDERKEEILPYLVRLRDEASIPMVYVSHDAAELRQLATQIVMLRHGRVTTFGGVKVLPGPPL
jgi:molybdate transport system ATP-binding protein